MESEGDSHSLLITMIQTIKSEIYLNSNEKDERENETHNGTSGVKRILRMLLILFFVSREAQSVTKKVD